jgi:periplasmic protein TonB
MEQKKSEKADLEKKSPVFFQMGLVITLGFVLFAFEYKSYDTKIIDIGARQQSEVMEETVLNTQQNTPPPPPPPQQQVTTVLEIVDNKTEVETNLSIDAEADENTQIETYVAPTQVEETEAQETEIFTVVEDQPGYPGGEEARLKYLSENTKYPQMARESQIQGTVYVTFVVEKDGRVRDVRVLRGIGGGCDEEAIRVIQNMPRWNPGKQRGKPVRVQFNLPIKFTLAG